MILVKPARKKKKRPSPAVEQKRDAYGFTVRPQHLQRYHEYAKIYKEEEEERSDRWKEFLERLAESSAKVSSDKSVASATDEQNAEEPSITGREDDNLNGTSRPHGLEEFVPERATGVRTHKVQIWSQIRPSLSPIQHMLSYRVKKKRRQSVNEQEAGRMGSPLASIEEEDIEVARPLRVASQWQLEEELYNVDRREPVQEALIANSIPFFPWKEELDCLIHGGLPMALRGELWQAFVGVRTRRIDGYYSELLAPEGNAHDDRKLGFSNLSATSGTPKTPPRCYPEIWKGQIEKDLPRTFPGHPALDEGGRDALRRLLTAYARHNPSVGYCQAMNFFAGLLLLMMPEENAFWTLLGIIDDYFDGYYSEEMIESQVDQLVFADLVREKFPKLVNHLDYLGVQVAWVTGSWFLSIFVNILPWESVLRVWDMLLFDGNRVMLFRTALALMELYAPALVTKKDAGDAITSLQSLAGSTFDSSQLVLVACMGYQSVNEMKLQDLRKTHRPSVIAAMEERSKGLHAVKDPKGLACKLYSFKHDSGTLLLENSSSDELSNSQTIEDSPLKIGSAEGYFDSLKVDTELDSVPDLQQQVTCLKVQLCRLLVEKRSAVLRADELEAAIVEIVKQDDRRLLGAKIEQLEQESSELHQALSSKREQEQAMLQVLIRLEQEQKVTEDARLCSEQDVAAQKYAAFVLQEKYEVAMASLAQMEKRAVMAESLLEAALQHR